MSIYSLPGAIYFHDCDLEKMIPIFLIVSAVAPMLFGGFAKQNDDESFGVGTCCGTIGFLFSLAWLIAGTLRKFAHTIYRHFFTSKKLKISLEKKRSFS